MLARECRGNIWSDKIGKYILKYETGYYNYENYNNGYSFIIIKSTRQIYELTIIRF